ncbi:MAG: hypothetical protein J5517_06525 [Eubacterium sp.]|nr:hypothetical protein [Eubacterium sp.]
MKKLEIVPFRKFWQDCFNCIVYSIIDYAFHVPDLYYYNNMYKYLVIDHTLYDHEKELHYNSIVPWTDNQSIFNKITKNNEVLDKENQKDVIQYIKDNIDKNRIVLPGVDLYYWIKAGLHYHHNHFEHFSLIIGYDDDTEEVIVLDTGDDMFAEFRVEYCDVIEAISHAKEIPTVTADIDYEADIKLFTKEELVECAKVLVKSIDKVIRLKDDIWNLDGLSDEAYYELMSILQTHTFSMQNRAKIDAYMFKNTFEDDRINGISLGDTLTELATKFGNIKMRCVKSLYRKETINEVPVVKEGVLELMEETRKLWNLFIENNDQLTMKCIEE